MPPRKTSRTHRKTSRKGTWKTSRSRKTTRRTTQTAYACSSPKFRMAKDECAWRIGSYRNVYSQFSASGSKTVFSPTTANRWIKYINSGVRVYKFNNQDFSKHFGTKWSTGTPTAARQYLKRKYGPGVKDVTRGKGSCWLVATTKNVSGHPFTPSYWK